MEEMNCRTTGEKASIFPGKSAAGILLAVKWEVESYYLISEICKELVETRREGASLLFSPIRPRPTHHYQCDVT